jgi:transposase InsO family protein
LAGVEDLWSRRLVGWSLSERINTPLVLAAWQMACTHRQPPPGLIFHSDQGVQYAGAQYTQALQKTQALRASFMFR